MISEYIDFFRVTPKTDINWKYFSFVFASNFFHFTTEWTPIENNICFCPVHSSQRSNSLNKRAFNDLWSITMKKCCEKFRFEIRYITGMPRINRFTSISESVLASRSQSECDSNVFSLRYIAYFCRLNSFYQISEAFISESCGATDVRPEPTRSPFELFRQQILISLNLDEFFKFN